MAKRSHGEGSVFFRDSINKWVGTITTGIIDGKQRRKTFYGDTKKEVLEKIKKFEANNFALNKDLSDIAFGLWFKRWIYEVKKPTLKPKSMQRYEGLLNNYISNAPFWDKHIEKIITSEIQIWYNQLAKDGVSNAQIMYINDLIKSSFFSAIDDRIIVFNPAKPIKLAKETSERINVLDVGEQLILVEHLKANRRQIGDLILFALGTGMRLGEILAVTWDDYDSTAKTIAVSKNLQRVKLDDGSYIDEVSTPKTHSGIRVLPLADNTVALLDDLFLANDEAINEKNLIFYNLANGKYIYNSTPTRHLKKYCIELGIREITMHGLRHTYATRLFEKKAEIKTVQKLMGHSDIDTTLNIYTHVMGGVKEEAVKELNGYL